MRMTRLERPSEDLQVDTDTEDEKHVPKQSKKERVKDDPEKTERTLFVGNVNVAVLEKANFGAFKALFKAYGDVESIRFRSLAMSEPMPRKVAFIQRKLHSSITSMNAYVVFTDKEAADKARKELNATEFMAMHLRVDFAELTRDTKKTVFVGNLAFDTNNEDLYAHFGACGAIENVRVIRDRSTQMGKGFAYVCFKDGSSVGLALKLNGTPLNTRPLRVTRCKTSDKQKQLLDRKKTKPGVTIVEGERAKKAPTGTKKKGRIRERTQKWKNKP